MIRIQEEIDEDVIGNVEKITSYIADENMNFVFELMSTRLYSNAIGSVIREITANSLDANIEADKNVPIVVTLDRDIENNSYYIEFSDSGNGINEKQFKSIYMSWFNSTKRESNKYTGYFGAGSKSPLAYSDYFYVTTVADSYKTKYIVSKSKEGPIAEKLVNTHFVTEPSGTVIRIDIKNDTDKDRFVEEIRKQLCYFEDVYIKCNFEYFDNHFRVYEGDTFKFRSGNIPYTSMHIILGSVVYPIDWRLIGINEIDIPVGVKFEIGSLQVVPSREALEYTQESKTLIKERIELCIEELKTKFNTQNPEIDDLHSWWERKAEIPSITFSPQYDNTIKDVLKIKGLGLKSAHVFGPLKEVIMPAQPLLEYEINHIQRGIVSKSTGSIYSAYRLSLCKTMYFAPNKMDKYNNIFISTGSVITEKRQSFQDICEALNINSHRVKYQRSWSWYKQVSKNENGYGNSAVKVPILGAAKLVYKYRQVMREYMMQYCKPYPSVSAQWIEDYKKEQHDNSAQLERKRNQGFFYSTGFEKRVETTIKKLELSKIIFYCEKDSEWTNKLSKYEDLIKNFYKDYKGRKKTHQVKNGKSYYYSSKKQIPMYQFIILNPTNYKIAKNLNNLVHIEDFWNVEEFQPLYNRLYFANLYNNFYQDIRDYKIQLVSDYHYDLKVKLRDFINKYYLHNIFNFEEDLKSIPIKNHSCTWQIRKIKKELQAFIDKAEILKYVQFDMPEKYLKLVIKQIKTTKIKQSLYGA